MNTIAPHYYTLGEAAERTGKSKGTIRNAIEKGRVSIVDKDSTGYKIDPAELHRVYPPITPLHSEEDGGLNDTTPPITPTESKGATSVQLASIEQKYTVQRLKDKEEQIIELKRHHETAIHDLREDRDHWRKQAEKITLLLEDQRKKETIEAPNEDSPPERIEAHTEPKSLNGWLIAIIVILSAVLAISVLLIQQPQIVSSLIEQWNLVG